MEKIQTEQSDRHKPGKNSGFIAVLTLLIMSLMVSSCTAIAEIFKAGMGLGIFIVLAVLVVIVFIIMRFRK